MNGTIQEYKSCILPIDLNKKIPMSFGFSISTFITLNAQENANISQFNECFDQQKNLNFHHPVQI
jgi:hypothetical protein